MTNKFPMHDPDTVYGHHMLCLGILARFYPNVPPEDKAIIEEAVESAALLGYPVNLDNLKNGLPLSETFT